MLSYQKLANVLVAVFLYVFPLTVCAQARDPLTVDLPQIEIIPGAEWFWVGQHMALNGVPMSVKMFTFRGKSEEVKRYYLSTWKSKGHGKVTENLFGEKAILGYELDGFYYSVQYEEASGVVQGKAVVTPTPLNYSSSKKSSLPLPPRTTVLSKVESLDIGRREETLSLECKMAVSYIVDFYKDQLVRDDWSLFSVSGDLQNSAVLSFQRNSELLQLTATALQHNNSQKTQFLIHWLK